jgi:transposase
MLIRYSLGEKKIWSVLQVPSEEDEDGRQLHRELSSLGKEKKRTVNRIRGLLATQGILINRRLDLSGNKIDKMRTWDKKPLKPGLKERIQREWAHVVFLEEQIRELTGKRDEVLRQQDVPDEPKDLNKIRQLQKLRAIGPNGAWILTKEFFFFLLFNNFF